MLLMLFLALSVGTVLGRTSIVREATTLDDSEASVATQGARLPPDGESARRTFSTEGTLLAEKPTSASTGGSSLAETPASRPVPSGRSRITPGLLNAARRLLGGKKRTPQAARSKPKAASGRLNRMRRALGLKRNSSISNSVVAERLDFDPTRVLPPTGTSPIPRIAFTFFVDFRALPETVDELKKKMEAAPDIADVNWPTEENFESQNFPPTLSERNIKSYWKNMFQVLPKNWKLYVIYEIDAMLSLLRYARYKLGATEKDTMFVLKILLNKNIDPPRRSDVYRFFLLLHFGGYWIDSTTVLFMPIEDFVPRDAGFVAPYMPWFDGIKLVFGVDYQVQKWRPKEVADEYKKKGVDIQDVPFKDRDAWERAVTFKKPLRKEVLTAIPENYFIGCAVGHPIMRRVFAELRDLWSFLDLENPQKMQSTSSFSDSCAKYYRKIAKDKFFTFNDQRYNQDDDSNLLFYKLSGGKLACYLINYIQLYNAISDHVKQGFKITEKGARYKKNMNNYLANVHATEFPNSPSGPAGKAVNERKALAMLKEGRAQSKMQAYVKTSMNTGMLYGSNAMIRRTIQTLKSHCRYNKRVEYDTCMSRIYTSRSEWHGRVYSDVFLASVQYPRFFKRLDVLTSESMLWDTFLDYLKGKGCGGEADCKRRKLMELVHALAIPFFKLSGFATEGEKSVAKMLTEVLIQRNASDGELKVGDNNRPYVEACRDDFQKACY